MDKASDFERSLVGDDMIDWAEAHIQIARMTLTFKLDRIGDSIKLANSAPPLSVIDSVLAPSVASCAYAQTLISK